MDDILVTFNNNLMNDQLITTEPWIFICTLIAGAAPLILARILNEEGKVWVGGIALYTSPLILGALTWINPMVCFGFFVGVVILTIISICKFFMCGD